jgi:hypothetical protein
MDLLHVQGNQIILAATSDIRLKTKIHLVSRYLPNLFSDITYTKYKEFIGSSLPGKYCLIDSSGNVEGSIAGIAYPKGTLQFDGVYNLIRLGNSRKEPHDVSFYTRLLRKKFNNYCHTIFKNGNY